MPSMPTLLVVLDIIKIIKLVITTILLFYMFYMLFFSAAGLIKTKKIISKSKKVNKFAIISAARNEEAVIANLVDSLKKADYPKDKFDIYVVPNNCTDGTEAIAEKAGAKIIKCEQTVHSKGDVLNEIIDRIDQNGDYDAYVIVDADNVVHSSFLSKMNNALNAGYGAAQGYRDSKNPGYNATSACCSIYYWMDNLFFSQGRWNIGLSALINGTGFMISHDHLKSYGGWRTFTLTEDIEHSGQCALKNETIAWVPDAIVYDEQPDTFIKAWKQRMRWTVGMYQCIKIYLKKFLSAIFRRGSYMNFDMMLFYGFPLVAVLGIVCALLVLAECFICLNASIMQSREVIHIIGSTLLNSYLYSTAVAFASVVFSKKSIKTSLKGILTFWLYVFSWLPITIICLFKKTQKWEEIKHTNNATAEELANTASR